MEKSIEKDEYFTEFDMICEGFMTNICTHQEEGEKAGHIPMFKEFEELISYYLH